MKKIFFTNRTTKIFSWCMTIIFLFTLFLAFFVFKNVNVGRKLLIFFGTFFTILSTIDISTYKLMIDEDTITSKNGIYYTLFLFLFSPRSKYITYRWDEIEKVIINATIFFEETAFINIFPRDASRKRLPLTISFISGIPASAVQEILSHIPKDAEVRIDPALKKYIDNPKRMYRYNITLGIIILVIIAIWTFWLFAFHNPLKGKKLKSIKTVSKHQQSIKKYQDRF